VVDNNHGTLTIKDSTLHNNPSRGFFYARLPRHLLPQQRPPDRDPLHDQLSRPDAAWPAAGSTGGTSRSGR
jgi:hypothetical protein